MVITKIWFDLFRIRSKQPLIPYATYLRTEYSNPDHLTQYSIRSVVLTPKDASIAMQLQVEIKTLIFFFAASKCTGLELRNISTDMLPSASLRASCSNHPPSLSRLTVQFARVEAVCRRGATCHAPRRRVRPARIVPGRPERLPPSALFLPGKPPTFCARLCT